MYWEWDLQRTQEKVRNHAATPADLAAIYVATGRNEKALEALEDSFERRIRWVIPFLPVEPMMDPLRSEPRFDELITRIAQIGSRPETGP